MTTINADSIAALAMGSLPGISVIVFDREMRVLSADGLDLGAAGLVPGDVVGNYAEIVLTLDHWVQYRPLFEGALRGEFGSAEVASVDGRQWLEVDVAPMRDEQGEIQGGVSTIRDITAARTAAVAMAQDRQLFGEGFERAPIGMSITTPEGRWVRVNRAMSELTGYTSEELLGRTFTDITHPDDRAADAPMLARAIAGEIEGWQLDKRYIKADGSQIWVSVSVSLVRDMEEEPRFLIGHVKDISERKQLEERLRYLADHDPLTGARNRRLFEQDLILQIGRSKRYGEQAVLLMIDLDDFKTLNDRLGHQVGDDVLRAAHRAMTGRLRSIDLVARLGGDEFAVLLGHTSDRQVPAVIADLRTAISGSADQLGLEAVDLKASIGSALIDEHTLTPNQVLTAADRAMYESKGDDSNAAPRR